MRNVASREIIRKQILNTLMFNKVNSVCSFSQTYLDFNNMKMQRRKWAQWIDFYNDEHLHGALLYLTPQDYFEGRNESRLAEKAYWLQQQQA